MFLLFFRQTVRLSQRAFSTSCRANSVQVVSAVSMKSLAPKVRFFMAVNKYECGERVLNFIIGVLLLSSPFLVQRSINMVGPSLCVLLIRQVAR